MAFSNVRIGRSRATLHHAGGAAIIATFHPSALPRERDEARRESMRQSVVKA